MSVVRKLDLGSTKCDVRSVYESCWLGWRCEIGEAISLPYCLLVAQFILLNSQTAKLDLTCRNSSLACV